jgi:drug/metabolite transporter (DMT)-like permease
MAYLALVSLIWAFSFGLIGNALGDFEPSRVAAARLLLALIAFMPFFRPSAVPRGSHRRLLLCGAVQFGLMYLCYIQAFRFIPSHLVALFSILTPVYVVLLHDLRRRQFYRRYLLAALLSVLGAAVIYGPGALTGSVWIGFGLMQLAGIAFAYGQIDFRDWQLENPGTKDREVFALLYAGACCVALPATLLLAGSAPFTPSWQELRALLYLGLVASGLGFFLWNRGAANSRPGTLAAFNNAVVPLGVAASLFVFGEIEAIDGESLIRLLLGSVGIIGAVLVAEKTPRET